MLSSLHADTPRTGGRGSVLQEYSQFPYEFYRLSSSLSGVTVVNFVLQITPEEKIARIKI
jgi:hypothetical protein